MPVSEAVELARASVDAFNRGDKAKWLETCHPELENFPPREWPEARPTKGAEAVRTGLEMADVFAQLRAAASR